MKNIVKQIRTYFRNRVEKQKEKLSYAKTLETIQLEDDGFSVYIKVYDVPVLTFTPTTTVDEILSQLTAIRRKYQYILKYHPQTYF